MLSVEGKTAHLWKTGQSVTYANSPCHSAPVSNWDMCQLVCTGLTARKWGLEITPGEQTATGCEKIA